LTGEETVLVVEMFGATTSQTLASAPETVIQEEVIPTPSSIAAVPVSPSEITLNLTPPACPPSELSTQPASLVRAESKPTIDSRVTSRAVSTVGLTFLAFAFIMDLVIVERRKIPRIVGHNLDHIMLTIGFLLFAILQASGSIL
jgi:hypothetical protein